MKIKSHRCFRSICNHYWGGKEIQKILEYTYDDDYHESVTKKMIHCISDPANIYKVSTRWFVEGVEYYPEESIANKVDYDRACIDWLRKVAHISNTDMLRYLQSIRDYNDRWQTTRWWQPIENE